MELFKEIAVIVILLVLGLLMLIRPDIAWKIEHLLSVKNGEATDWYLAITRLIGFACLFVAVILVFVFVIW